MPQASVRLRTRRSLKATLSERSSWLGPRTIKDNSSVKVVAGPRNHRQLNPPTAPPRGVFCCPRCRRNQRAPTSVASGPIWIVGKTSIVCVFSEMGRGGEEPRESRATTVLAMIDATDSPRLRRPTPSWGRARTLSRDVAATVSNVLIHGKKNLGVSFPFVGFPFPFL
jgi:hypothetical protein